MNTVTIIGRLTRDPELGYTQSQKAKCTFTVAVNRLNSDSDFIRVTAWNKQAENCEKHLVKGDQVGVKGSIKTGSYEKDGRKINTFEIWADEVEFLQKKKTEFAEMDEAVPF